MAKAVSNETAVLCTMCEGDIAEGAGVPYYEWNNDGRYVCRTCEDKRIAEKRRLEEKQTRAGQVLFSLLPAIGKLGAVRQLGLGEGSYVARVTIRVNGHDYILDVTEKDEA